MACQSSDQSHRHEVFRLSSEYWPSRKHYVAEDDSFQKLEDHHQSPFSRLSSKYPVGHFSVWATNSSGTGEWNPDLNLESGPGRMMYGSNLARKSPVVDPSRTT
ncbi:hypothetical protein BDV10DRAFT_190050 [Aspergillus recurvatus]